MDDPSCIQTGKIMHFLTLDQKAVTFLVPLNFFQSGWYESKADSSLSVILLASNFSLFLECWHLCLPQLLLL